MTRLSERFDLEGHIFLLLKFGEKVHLESLQGGTLYMNNFNYFIEREKSEQKKGIGDKFEASHVMVDMQFRILNPESGEEIAVGDAGLVQFRADRDLKRPVFCLTAVTANDLEIVTEEENMLKTKLAISDYDKVQITQNFGDWVLVISPNQFLKQVRSKFEEEGIAFVGGKVKYTDYSVNDKKRLDSYKTGNTDIYFWKDNTLEYQREYRLVVLNRDVDDKLIVNIGNLQDSILMPTGKLLNGEFGLVFNA